MKTQKLALYSVQLADGTPEKGPFLTYEAAVKASGVEVAETSEWYTVEEWTTGQSLYSTEDLDEDGNIPEGGSQKDVQAPRVCKTTYDVQVEVEDIQGFPDLEALARDPFEEIVLALKVSTREPGNGAAGWDPLRTVFLVVGVPEYQQGTARALYGGNYRALAYSRLGEVSGREDRNLTSAEEPLSGALIEVCRRTALRQWVDLLDALQEQDETAEEV